MTALDCAPLGPYEPLTTTPLPAEVFANAAERASYAGLGTEYATRRIVPPPPAELEQALTPTAAAIVTAIAVAYLRERERDIVIPGLLSSCRSILVFRSLE